MSFECINKRSTAYIVGNLGNQQSNFEKEEIVSKTITFQHSEGYANEFLIKAVETFLPSCSL